MCALPANQLYNVQVLDKAFMSGVLVMTAFWATAVAQNPLIAPASSDRMARVSDTKARPLSVPATAAAWLATAIKAPFRTTTAEAASSGPPAAARTAAVSEGLTHSPSSGPGIGTVPQTDAISLAAVQIMNSLSYLQFCRMRLTAYNTVLKAVLASVSTSPQVHSWPEVCTTPPGSVLLQRESVSAGLQVLLRY